MKLLAALKISTGRYLTKDGDGTPDKAAIYHDMPENELQKIVFEGLQKTGYAMLVVAPIPNEEGYLSVAFYEGKPVFYRIANDELILSDSEGVLLEEKSKKFLEESWGVLPVEFQRAVWKSKGFYSPEDETQYLGGMT